jgi:hypothetical protein
MYVVEHECSLRGHWRWLVAPPSLLSAVWAAPTSSLPVFRTEPERTTALLLQSHTWSECSVFTNTSEKYRIFVMDLKLTKNQLKPPVQISTLNWQLTTKLSHSPTSYFTSLHSTELLTTLSTTDTLSESELLYDRRVYRQSVRLGDKRLEIHDQQFFFFNRTLAFIFLT